MHRRSFLKAMGIGGALSMANWTTLIRGPEPGDKIYTGVIRKRSVVFAVAGAPIDAGMLVMWGSDGRVYPAQPNGMGRLAGVAGEKAMRSNPCEVIAQGSTAIEIDDFTFYQQPRPGFGHGMVCWHEPVGTNTVTMWTEIDG